MIINDDKNGTILYNGKSSADFGMFVQKLPVLRRPERDGQTVYVPGRNGAIVIENCTYKNYVQPYEIALTDTEQGVAIASRAVSEWLLNTQGYIRLEDSFEPDVYRMARFAGPLDIEQIMEQDGKAVIEFDCMPQRYCKFGEAEMRVRNNTDAGGLVYGDVVVKPVPFGTKAVYVECLSGSAICMGNYRDEDGAEIGVGIYDTPVSVPDGAAEVTFGWNNATEDSLVVMGIVDANGDKIPLCGARGTSPVVFNPTEHEALPLLQFVDTSTEPPVVRKELTKVPGSFIFKDGSVLKTAWESQTGMYTTEPVSVSGGGYAIITGISYAFFDSNGKLLRFYEATANSAGTYLKSTRVIVPDNAVSVIVGGVDESGGDYNVTLAALSLQAKRQSPGAAAVTINGIAINLDFSEHDTILLDCDLHDAQYIDGSSANNEVSFTSDIDPYPTFPKFYPGDNSVIVRDGANIRFSVFPRWWIL